MHASGLPLEYDPALNRVTGDFPVTVDSYQWFDYLCFQTGGTATPGAPGTLQLLVVPNIVENVDASGRVASFGPPTIELQVTPGAIETTNACGLTGLSGPFYHDLWNKAFADRRLPPPDSAVAFGATDWSFAGADPWATADVSDSHTPGGVEVWNAHVRIVLHHTPHTG